MPVANHDGAAWLPPEFQDGKPGNEHHADGEGQRNPEHRQLEDRRLFLELLDEGGNEERKGAGAHDEDKAIDEGRQIGLPASRKPHDQGLDGHVRTLGIGDGTADEGDGQQRDFRYFLRPQHGIPGDNPDHDVQQDNHELGKDGRADSPFQGLVQPDGSAPARCDVPVVKDLFRIGGKDLFEFLRGECMFHVFPDCHR
jgi:hypothetical protein